VLRPGLFESTVFERSPRLARMPIVLSKMRVLRRLSRLNVHQFELPLHAPGQEHFCV
jgi:hypothetical protein